MGTQTYFNVARKGPPGGDGTYNDIASRYEKVHQDYQFLIQLEWFKVIFKILIRWCFFVEDYDENPLKDLYNYDYPLYSLIYEAFPCTNDIIDRCGNQGNIHGNIPMNCNGGGGGSPIDCRDEHQHCEYWSATGECSNNPGLSSILGSFFLYDNVSSLFLIVPWRCVKLYDNVSSLFLIVPWRCVKN